MFWHATCLMDIKRLYEGLSVLSHFDIFITFSFVSSKENHYKYTTINKSFYFLKKKIEGFCLD